MTWKPVCLIITLLIAMPLKGEDLRGLIERLPRIRTQALQETKALRSGSTVQMVEAAARVRDALRPPLVRLEAVMTKKDESDTSKLIERDLEAIARDAHIRGHAEGWGGTAVTVESAWAVVEHMESRISWCVWQLMAERKEFRFNEWLIRWTDNNEGGKAANP